MQKLDLKMNGDTMNKTMNTFLDLPKPNNVRGLSADKLNKTFWKQIEESGSLTTLGMRILFTIQAGIIYI